MGRILSVYHTDTGTLSVHLSGAARWDCARIPFFFLRADEKAVEEAPALVQDAFRRHDLGWANFSKLHIELKRRNGQAWGHKGVFPDPCVLVENLHTKFEQGSRLKELIARGVSMAGRQVDVVVPNPDELWLKFVPPSGPSES